MELLRDLFWDLSSLIFIKDVEEKTKRIPIKFVDNIKLKNRSHRNTENFKLEGNSVSHFVHTPLKAGLVRPGSTGPYPAKSCISPKDGDFTNAVDVFQYLNCMTET